MKRTWACLLSAAVMLSACALPNTEVHSVSPRPMLAIFDAPPSAIVYLDAQPLGKASDLDGTRKQTVIEEGMHRLEVRLDTTLLYSEQFYISSGETHRVSVGKGGQ